MRASFDHIGLSVADLDTQAAWYAKALGLHRRGRFEVASLSLRGEFVCSDEGWAIELLERHGSSGGLRAPDHATALLTQGYGHLCLRVDDVDAVCAALIAHGGAVRLAPQAAPEPGVRMAFVSDPEGNLIELIDRGGPIAAGLSGTAETGAVQ